MGTLNAEQAAACRLAPTLRQIGRLTNRVTATADGGLTAKAGRSRHRAEAQLAVTKTGLAMRYVGRNAVWDIKVTNPAETPLTSVVVRDQLPAELGFVSASDGGQLTGNEVVWNIWYLNPRKCARST